MIETLFRFPADIEGYPTEAECRALYELACDVPEQGVIVELGSYKGRSAISMAQAGRCVYAVDHFVAEPVGFKGFPDHHEGRYSSSELRANAARYDLHIHIRAGDTVEQAERWEDRPIDMLFIDAGHAYEQVKADFEAWSPFLTEHATVVFDDSLFPGVMRFLMELRDWVPIPGPQVGGLTAMQRKAVS